MKTAIEMLSTLLYNLNKLTDWESQFIQSVNSFYQRKGYITEKQEAVLKKIYTKTTEQGKLVEEIAKHYNLFTIAKMFQRAESYLQYPTIELLLSKGKVKIYKSPNGAYLHIFFHEYRAKAVLSRSGEILSIPNGASREILEYFDELQEFCDNPQEAVKLQGRKTGRCCFCKQELTNETSVSLGYGPICAQHYGLPWRNPTDVDVDNLI